MRTFNAPVGTDKVRNGLAVPQIGFVMFVYFANALHTFLAISFMAMFSDDRANLSANMGLYCITCFFVTLCHIGRITFLPSISLATSELSGNSDNKCDTHG